MKNLFKLFLMVSLFVSLSMNAQLKYGFQLGLNATSATATVSNEYIDMRYPPATKLGYNLGFVVSYDLNDDMALQSGLLYSNKGYAIDLQQLKKDFELDGELSGSWKINYNYLELPLHFVYNINDFKIYAGPYFAYGLSGKAVMDVTEKDGSDTETYDYTSDINPVTGDVNAEDAANNEENSAYWLKVFNAFDVGVNFGVGYQYNQLLIRAQYSIGFSNLTPNIIETNETSVKTSSSTFDHNDYKYTNNGFSFSIAYLLGGE